MPFYHIALLVSDRVFGVPASLLSDALRSCADTARCLLDFMFSSEPNFRSCLPPASCDKRSYFSKFRHWFRFWWKMNHKRWSLNSVDEWAISAVKRKKWNRYQNLCAWLHLEANVLVYILSHHRRQMKPLKTRRNIGSAHMRIRPLLPCKTRCHFKSRLVFFQTIY